MLVIYVGFGCDSWHVANPDRSGCLKALKNRPVEGG